MYFVHKPHLRSGYLKSVQFDETTDAEGNPDWIMYFTPGPKAHAEYRAFNRKQLAHGETIIIEEEIELVPSKREDRGAVPPRTPDQSPQQPALPLQASGPTPELPPHPEVGEWPTLQPELSPLQLVQYFHTRARGKDSYEPHGTKEVDQAASLSARYGEEKARFIVDFAIQEAQKTNFKMRTFGALFQYVSDALAEWDYQEIERERVHKLQARVAEETRQQEDEQRGGEELLEQLSPDQFQTLYDVERQRLFERLPQAAQWESPVLEATIRAALINRLLNEQPPNQP